MTEVEAFVQRALALTPEQIAEAVLTAEREAERINAEFAQKIRVDWRTLHEPMTI